MLDDQNRLVAATPSNGNYYVRYNNGWTTTTTASQATTITATYVDAGTDLAITPYVDNSTQTVWEQVDVDMTVGTAAGLADWRETVVTTEPSSYTTNPTYLPLSMDDNGKINRRNTGYIVSGAQFGTPGTEAYGQSNAGNKGDIRVSYYANSNISESTTGTGTNRRLAGTSIRTINGTSDHTLTNAEIAAFHKFTDSGGTQGSFSKMNAVLAGDTDARIYGLHFMNAAISEDNLITVANAKVNGKTYESFELPRDSIDFTLKERGIINFFAGTYYSGNDSFFSLHKIERNEDGTIASIKEILEIYGNGNKPYVYRLRDKNGAVTYESWEYYPSGTVKSHTVYGSLAEATSYSSVFNTNWIKKQNSLTTNAVYYFEIPVDQGEYALGSVDGGTGAYLMYLDIGAAGTALKPEGNAKLIEAEFNDLIAKHTDAGEVSYTVPGGSRDSEVKTKPTYFPLAMTNGTVADSNTGYVISGISTDSSPPGDIRVSRYTKYAGGDWGSIRSSLTEATNAGILNNGRVYTIVNGRQQSVTDYGIGNQYTMQYDRVSAQVNGQLQGQPYVYGMHFMQSAISPSRTVTVPRAVINGTTYTDYVMPQDCIDFNVATKGRITFMAGTYFSGSNGTTNFFSLHQIFRDGQQAITAIRELAEIYGDGTREGHYVYRYYNGNAVDSTYYDHEGNALAGLPGGYQLIYSTAAIRSPLTAGITFNGQALTQLTQNSVYYFEVPVDAGEFALGSAAGDGAYLIYLDIAANAEFSVKTTTTEVTETIVHTYCYPNGVAFVDAVGSTVFDTDGVADPLKSVFLSIPVANSAGQTTFAMSASGALTVTGDSSLAGYSPQNVPDGTSLIVNGGTPITMAGRTIVVEKVTEINTDPDGTTITTVTVTTQTTENGATTTTVEQTVSEQFGSTQTTTVTSPPPAYDGHTLIPNDLTAATQTTAAIILEMRAAGQGLAFSTARNGNLNTVETDSTLTIDDETYTVCDVIMQQGEENTPAGTYAVTMTGPAGSYTVTVVTVDAEFVFTLGGSAINATGDIPVTLTA
ncbi:MAG: hypothetical protein ACOYJY_06285 [Acutalibacteraceae bacterium]